MTGEVVQVSNVVSKAFMALYEHSKRDDLAPLTREKIISAAKNCGLLLKQVRDVETIALLKVEEKEDGEPVDFTTVPIENLPEVSQLIGALHRGGISIHAVESFDNEQLRLAKLVASKFADVSSHLKAFRGSQFKPEKGTYSFLTRGGNGFGDFINFLTRQKLVKIRGVLIKAEEGWRAKQGPWAKSEAEDELLVIYEERDKAGIQFLRGDWMTAFTRDVITDHLDRNKKRHETFSKVRYSAPIDVINSSSDFDVITLVGNKALCVECKSGKMDAQQVLDIAQKSLDVSKVLKQFVDNIQEFRFFTVFDHTTNDEAEVRELFDGTNVAPIRIDQIRQTVFDNFN